MTDYQRLYLPPHIKAALAKDPMFLQRKRDQEVARFRLATGADIWRPSHD